MLTLLQEPYLLEKYEVKERIGEGQYSFVYRGVVRATGQDVVLKFWPALEISQTKDREWLQEDLETYIQLHHPYIMPVLEARVLERAVYVVTAYAAHGSLQDRLTRVTTGELLPVGTAQKIISQIGQALQYIHQHGLSHGDVVPGNILFNERDDACLSDFYYARFQSLTQGYTGESSSMRWYLAPELMTGVFSPASDQYALACIAYVLFCGQVPFVGNARTTLVQKHKNETPSDLLQHNSALPLFVNDAVLKALSKDPADRFPDIEAFLKALQVPVEPYPVVDFSPDFVPAAVASDFSAPVIDHLAANLNNPDSAKPHDGSYPGLPQISGPLPLDQVGATAVPAEQVTDAQTLADTAVPAEQLPEVDQWKGDLADPSQPFELPPDVQQLFPPVASQPLMAFQGHDPALLAPAQPTLETPALALSQPLPARQFQLSTEGRLFPGRFSAVRAQKDRSLYALVPMVAVALVIFLIATVTISAYTFYQGHSQSSNGAVAARATSQATSGSTQPTTGVTVPVVAPTPTHASVPVVVPTIAPTPTPVPVIVPTPTSVPTTAPTAIPTTVVPTPTPTATVKLTVVPVLNCVQHQSRGTFLAKFGYISYFSQAVYIPVGAENSVTPFMYNGFQTTTFSPGENDAVVQVHSSTTASWTLDGVTVVATYNSSPTC